MQGNQNIFEVQAFPAVTGQGYKEGMTLRDYFAGQVITALSLEWDYQAAARKAYEAADEMMHARAARAVSTGILGGSTYLARYILSAKQQGFILESEETKAVLEEAQAIINNSKAPCV